jgi:hypothetical protein
MTTLAELVRAILANCPEVTSREDVRLGLESGQFMVFVEAHGKSLDEASTMLWDAVRIARMPS